MVNVVPLDICGVILGNSFMWDRDGIYYKKLNKLQLMNDGKVFQVNTHKSKKRLPMVIASQVKHLGNASKKFVLIMVKIQSLDEVNVTLSMVCNTDFRAPIVCKREE